MTTYRDSLIVAMVLFLLLDTAVIGARLLVRTRLLSRAFGRDDFILCLTYVSIFAPSDSPWALSSLRKDFFKVTWECLDRICDPLWL